MQVRRQPRGAVAAERVVVVGVVAHDPSAGSATSRSRAARLAARRGSFDLLLEPELGERREPALAHARRQRAERPRPADHLAPRRVEPRPVERREDGVGAAGLRADRVEVVDGVQAGMREATARRPRAPRARSRRRANGPESALKCSSRAPASRASAGSSRSGAPRRTTSRPPSRSSRSARHSSRNCVRGPEAWRPCSSRSSKQNTGTTRSQRVERRAQRGMVVHAQVAREPQEGGHRSASATARGGGRRCARGRAARTAARASRPEHAERQGVAHAVADHDGVLAGGLERVGVLPQRVRPAQLDVDEAHAAAPRPRSASASGQRKPCRRSR